VSSLHITHGPLLALRLLQAAVLAFWLRLPASSPLVHAYLGAQAAFCVADILGGWCCLRTPNGGPYARVREFVAATARLSHAVLGSASLWPLVWLAMAAPGSSSGGAGWLAAARHAATLLWSSAAPGSLLLWFFTLRI
jgi:hypothetical protein